MSARADLPSMDDRYRQLADAMPQIVWTADATGAANYFNWRWFEYTGMTPEEAGPNAWQLVVHPDDLPSVIARREQTLRSGETFETEYRFRGADGRYRWHLGRAVPLRAADGSIELWVGTATDIHDRKRIEEQRSFIVAAGDMLSSSLDYRDTLGKVAALAAVVIADWCSIHVVELDRTITELASASRDPAKTAFACPVDVAAVIRTSEPELILELGPSSYLCVPLKGRDAVLGAITLAATESGQRLGAEDLSLAEELARRAATAIENARLYHELEARAQAARVLATIGDGVFLIDRSGDVRLWNSAAESITGLHEAEVLGRPAAAVLPGWEGVEALIPVAGSGEPARAESIPFQFGARELWLSISAVGYEDGTVYAFRDLTDERALESMRQDLVATVSHELRTPLAAIYGSALTLRRSDVTFDVDLRNKLLDVIAEESDRLANIVNDLLLASQLDSGKVKANIERCDPRVIAKAVIDAAHLHLPDGVQLELSARDELPAVAADSGQLRQVLSNLIENAIKYSPNGGAIGVALESGDRHVRFAITDAGLGIPPAEQQRIFHKFYRLDPHMSRGIGGTGLGLYICRELVRRVDGRIWVESDGSSGSTFFVEIPQEAPAPAATASQRRVPSIA
jgi:PAS domain S-box-containing protein